MERERLSDSLHSRKKERKKKKVMIESDDRKKNKKLENLAKSVKTRGESEIPELSTSGYM